MLPVSEEELELELDKLEELLDELKELLDRLLLDELEELDIRNP